MWTATFDEMSEPVTATGDTPQAALDALETALKANEEYFDPGYPLQLWEDQGKHYVADGPVLLGRVYPTGQPFEMDAMDGDGDDD